MNLTGGIYTPAGAALTTAESFGKAIRDFFVYRYLPIDEKINLPLRVLRASEVDLDYFVGKSQGHQFTLQ